MASEASNALAERQKVEKFLNAARTGNLDLFKKMSRQLEEEGKGLGNTIAAVKDANQRGALHFAAREGSTQLCKYLLEDLNLGSIVDVKDEDGETPLIHAARQGHVSTAKYLVEHGADPAASSNLGTTPLHHAAGIGNIELLSFILSKGVDVDSESDAGVPLIWAAGHGQQEAVKVLLENCANPNAGSDDNITPLLSSVAAGSLPCLELLLKAGASANVIAGGTTPLHIAAYNGGIDIIHCLLDGGADPNITDEDGMKPVQVAASRGNREAVEILVPVTSCSQDIPEWSADGIIKHMQSQMAKEVSNSFLEAGSVEEDLLKDTNLRKPEIMEVTPEARKKALDAKSRGDQAFRKNDFLMAVDAYTQAIDLDPTDATLFSNRSICWIRLGQAEIALSDAKACKELRPNWAKACYRVGAALRLLQRFDEAANAFYEGVMIDLENKELISAFREAVEAGRKFHGTDKTEARNKDVIED